jgi:type IV pilus assembly protein PilQ
LYSPSAGQGGTGTVGEYANQNINILNNSTKGLSANSATTVTKSEGKNGVQISPNALGVNLPNFTNAGGTLAFSLFSASMSQILNLEIAALESDGVGKIISSPRVITANNKKAKINDGTQIPYVVSTVSSSGTSQTVMFKDAMLSLEAEPQITPEGTIRLILIVKKEEPDWNKSILGNPPIKSSTVETTVVVDNGGTVVIGGVFITDSTNSVDKVPFLGDIPFLGWLFKYKREQGRRRELLVFITPRIVSDKLRFD